MWKPSAYPETEEDRVKAAKKYGLIVEVIMYIVHTSGHVRQIKLFFCECNK